MRLDRIQSVPCERLLSQMIFLSRSARQLNASFIEKILFQITPFIICALSLSLSLGLIYRLFGPLLFIYDMGDDIRVRCDLPP